MKFRKNKTEIVKPKILKKREIKIKQLVFVCVFTYQRVLLVVLSVCPTFTDAGGIIRAVALFPDQRERLIRRLETIQGRRMRESSMVCRRRKREFRCGGSSVA